MHWADRYAALHKAGWTPTTVARELGCQPNAVSAVLRDKAVSYNIASFIAAKTGIPLHRLWPDGRYDNPSGRRRWKKSNVATLRHLADRRSGRDRRVA